MYVFSGFFDEYEVKMFYFTVTFNQVNASLLIKSINAFKKHYWPQTFSSSVDT